MGPWFALTMRRSGRGDVPDAVELEIGEVSIPTSAATPSTSRECLWFGGTDGTVQRESEELRSLALRAAASMARPKKVGTVANAVEAGLDHGVDGFSPEELLRRIDARLSVAQRRLATTGATDARRLSE
jgi:hypothetical protein